MKTEMAVKSLVPIVVIIIFHNGGSLLALDETLFIERFGSAKLPCETDDKPFLSGTNTVYWYKGTELSPDNLILVHSLTLDRVEYNEGYSDKKYQYDRDDQSLTVTNVDYTDEEKYRCESSYPDGVITSLIILVPPSQPSLTLPNFQENTATSIQCRVSAVKPGVGSVVFTVTVYPDFSVQSSDSDISEGPADATSGGLSVTYSPQISLQRKHNGQQALCTVVWREKTVTSDSETVDVRFTATSIIMTQSPSALVPADTEITFTCLTDEANPTASVTWTVGGASRSSTTDSTVDDNEYNTLKRQSVLVLTADKTLHNKKVKCVLSDNRMITAEETLNVGYPPEVSVQSVSNVIQEGSHFITYCHIVAGNPEELTSQYWEFEPKYHDRQTQALPEQRDNRELRIEKTVYSDAGTYRCTAGNAAGSDTGEIQAVVHYSPKLLKTSGSLKFFSGLYQNVTLHLTVRAFPEFTDVQSAFMWYFVNNSIRLSSAEIKSTKLGPEVFQSVLNINYVGVKDYGVFIVTTNNGIGAPVKFSIILEEKGPPEAVRNFSITAKASDQAIFAWRSGLTGGFIQTFKLVLKNKSEEYILYTHYNTSSVDELFTYKLTDLKPETPYSIAIVSINEYNGYSETESKEMTFSTRKKPLVNQKDLLSEFIGSFAGLSWQYDTTDDNYTTVFIEQCNITGECVQHDVTNNTQHILVVSVLDGNMFYLVIYQDGLEAFRSESFTEIGRGSGYDEVQDITQPSTSNNAGVIAGVLVCVVILIAIVVLITTWFYRRNHNKKRPAQTSDAPMYINVQASKQIGFENPQDNSFYQELLPVGFAKPENSTTTVKTEDNNYQTLCGIQTTEPQLSQDCLQGELGALEATVSNPRVVHVKDEDLSLHNILHKGRYTILKKGRLNTESGEIAVAVKSMKENATPGELQYLVNQINCLKKIGLHANIAEMLLLPESGNMETKLVTMYYINGNLRNFLQKFSAHKQIFYEKTALGIIEGLSYLERQKPEILHFCLSAEHVLVDHICSCRLTGFDFKHNVLLREMEEEDEGIYGSIEWKAPETIEDCKAHTKLSDVWAFGVLLYEIYTNGKIPYDGMLEEDIKTFIRDARILPIPDGCPIDLYRIMTKCWTYDAQQRPTFSSLRTEIAQLYAPTQIELERVTNDSII